MEVAQKKFGFTSVLGPPKRTKSAFGEWGNSNKSSLAQSVKKTFASLPALLLYISYNNFSINAEATQAFSFEIECLRKNHIWQWIFRSLL